MGKSPRGKMLSKQTKYVGLLVSRGTRIGFVGNTIILLLLSLHEGIGTRKSVLLLILNNVVRIKGRLNEDLCHYVFIIIITSCARMD